MLQDIENYSCCWCDSVMNLIHVESFSGERFCDICCAKLYYDNVKTIKINMRKYNTYCANNYLDERSKEIYMIISGSIFETLPVYSISGESRIDAKRNYYNLLRSIYTQT